MYRGLYETVLNKSLRSFHFECWDERFVLLKIFSGNRRINNLACRLKIHDVSVSTVILRTGDRKN